DVQYLLRVKIEHPKNLIDVFRQLPETLLTLEIGDVDIGADKTRENSSGRKARNSAAENQPVLSIGSAQPVLDLKVSACIECGGEGFVTALKVIGVHAGRPAVPQFLFHPAAGKLEPGLIDKGELPVGAGDPDHYGRRIGHVAEALFTFPQRSLGLLSFADIGEQSEESGGSACVIVYRHARNTDPDRRSAGASQPKI